MALMKSEYLWYTDQFTSYIGLIVSLYLLIIVIKKLNRKAEDGSASYPLQMKILIYVIYSMALIYFISAVLITIGLPMINSLSSNQVNAHLICNALYSFCIPSMALSQIAIINLFLHRLQISFTRTSFQLQKYCIYSFRIIISMIWVILASLAAVSMRATPYNIYTEQIDYTETATTCSVHSVEQNMLFMISVSSIGLLIFMSNIIVWILFMNRLYKLIIRIQKIADRTEINPVVDSQTSEHHNWANDEFVILMKEQTMLVCIVVFSTIFAWLLGAMSVFGNLPVNTDFALSLSVIFLSFKFNRWYFQFFKCDKLTTICCKCCEQFMIKKITKNELNIVKSMNKVSEHPTSTGTDHEVPV